MESSPPWNSSSPTRSDDAEQPLPTSLASAATTAAPSSLSASSSQRHETTRRGREYTVYDAVAGRVTLKEPISSAAHPNHPRHRRRRSRSGSAGHFSSRSLKLAPEEVLFRRRNAPTRYIEKDIYWAHEDLPSPSPLPESTLLKTVHAYASRFYHAKNSSSGPRDKEIATVDERSMDETALLTFGILLEEASRYALGKRGDLVFTEASESSSRPSLAATPVVSKRAVASRSGLPNARGEEYTSGGGGGDRYVSDDDGDGSDSSLPPQAKRRRT